jgi:hypothetical protein
MLRVKAYRLARVGTNPMNWANRLALTANLAIFVMAVLFIGKYGLSPGPGTTWHYSDLVVIVLTAVGVLITALGVGIAIMALWGYQKITDHAVDQSLKFTSDRVTKRLEEYLSTQEVQERIRALVDAKVAQASDQVYADLAPSYPAGQGAQGNGG